MQKWFIIQEGSHLGPYSEEVLHEMYQGGKINEKTPIWAKENTEPKTYGECFHSSDLEEVEIDLELEDSDTPPELPPEAITQIPENKIQKIKEAAPLPKKPEKKKTLLWSLSLFLFILIGFSALYYLQGNVSLTRPSGMKLSDFEQAKNKLTQNQFSFYLSKDRKQIFMIAPHHGEFLLGIKLDLVVRESLSENPVSLTAVVKFDNYMATIKEFTFLKGDRFVEGHYQVEVRTLESKKYPFPYSLIHSKKPITYNEKVLITGLKEKDFLKARDLYWKSIKENESKFWQDLFEQYQTLSAIITQIKDSLENVFILSTSLDEAVERFEKNYKENFGMFFTSFVIANDKNTKTLAAEDFPNKTQVLGHYSHLSRLAKSVGSETMEILHDLETFQNYKNLNETDIKNKSLLRLETLLKEAKEKEDFITQNYFQ